jgi:uncharacterized protein YlzI (FlbEa/FlbD family)
MIKVSDIDGRERFLAESAIAQITAAGSSQAWHGIRANIKIFNGEWIEVRESPQAIADQISKAAA